MRATSGLTASSCSGENTNRVCRAEERDVSLRAPQSKACKPRYALKSCEFTHGHQGDLDCTTLAFALAFASSGPNVARVAVYVSHMHPSRTQNAVRGRLKSAVRVLMTRSRPVRSSSSSRLRLRALKMRTMVFTGTAIRLSAAKTLSGVFGNVARTRAGSCAWLHVEAKGRRALSVCPCAGPSNSGGFTYPQNSFLLACNLVACAGPHAGLMAFRPLEPTECKKKGRTLASKAEIRVRRRAAAAGRRNQRPRLISFPRLLRFHSNAQTHSHESGKGPTKGIGCSFQE